MNTPLIARLLPATAFLCVACQDLPPVPAAPNVPPTASFYYNPVAPITAGETRVAFNAIASRDSDGQVVSYIWDFGDGTPPLTSDSPVVTHVFPDTAARCLDITYGVLLTVVDDAGGRGYASQAVRVTENPPPTDAACR